MREILFRGKTPGGWWVYGDHIKDRIQTDGKPNEYIMIRFFNVFEGEDFEDYEFIIPETIGQYTGLKDKNGKKIFDGDIIKWDDDSNGKYWRVAVVKINPDLQFECFDCPLIKNSSAHGHVFHFGNFIYQETENWIEIIGNKYDNPELFR